MAFIKRLKHSHDPVARKRFRREAVAYETLSGLGLPGLLEDNSEAWEDSDTPLYLATDYVPGGSLQHFVAQGGHADLNDALACVGELGRVLDGCHATGVTHRDIKPANVVLRDGNLSTPVLVDLGLSFNDADEDDDLTRAGWEVGNRFLRLPEHASGGRDAVSDVTQLAGIFVYILTGREPRVLVDEAGLMPHERPEERNALASLLGPRQLLRVLYVLDRAFAQQQSMRYSKPLDLVSDLESAMTSDGDGGDAFDDLLARVKEIARSKNLPALAARRNALTSLLNSMNGVVQSYATSEGLVSYRQSRGSQGQNRQNRDELHGETYLAIAESGDHLSNDEYSYVEVESRGTHDYVVRIDGMEAWRGESADQDLTDAITQAVAAKFVARYVDEADD